jgi:hypothetical protein
MWSDDDAIPHHLLRMLITSGKFIGAQIRAVRR